MCTHSVVVLQVCKQRERMLAAILTLAEASVCGHRFWLWHARRVPSTKTQPLVELICHLVPAAGRKQHPEASSVQCVHCTPSVPAVQKDTIPDWAPMSTVAGQPQPVRRRTRGRDRLVTMSGVPRVPSAVSMAGASRKVETVASRAHGPAVLPCCLGHSVSKAVFVDRSDTSAQQHVAVAISGEAVRWRA